MKDLKAQRLCSLCKIMPLKVAEPVIHIQLIFGLLLLSLWFPKLLAFHAKWFSLDKMYAVFVYRRAFLYLFFLIKCKTFQYSLKQKNCRNSMLPPVLGMEGDKGCGLRHLNTAHLTTYGHNRFQFGKIYEHELIYLFVLQIFSHIYFNLISSLFQLCTLPEGKIFSLGISCKTKPASCYTQPLTRNHFILLEENDNFFFPKTAA